MDTICYMPVEKKEITIYVPKEPAAIEVSQIVDEEISYKVLSYNHHSLKGNIIILMKQMQEILIRSFLILQMKKKKNCMIMFTTIV